MNDYHDSRHDSDDDRMCEDVFAHLKRLEPPLETRIRNRAAVAAELSSLVRMNRQRHLPWWRRSISIPVPIFAGLVVLFAFALQSSYRGWHDRSFAHVGAPDQPAEREAYAPRKKTAIAKRTNDAHSVLQYRATETYLCGVGCVNSEYGYFIKEQNP